MSTQPLDWVMGFAVTFGLIFKNPITKQYRE